MLARNPEYMGYRVKKQPSFSIPLRTTESCMTINCKRIVKAIGLAAVFLVLYVNLSAIKTSNEYALSNIKLQTKQLQQENDNLRVDIAQLEAPERIYTMATTELGMVSPAYILYNQKNQGNVTNEEMANR
ncbi:cell division protein FtsL [Megasphaera hutchinsoni]|uniref:Cell division protein FtsL n=1 Tax=Megasphaera hutchinsoni TaxID=1588748 RepID=A0A134CKP3_9FIRM|nr:MULTISPECIES: cell division protein FtsL [Megasphaera]KXB92783.1 putative cell division protein FtsL [Megasphaera hutchinsoni]MUP59457.1 cell division protein FtsL [Veillonellaceae bacterium M2-4]PNH21694.1 cell division protein FtsL [Megasphaera genomosp. type_2]